ncbi:phage holin family protein [Lysobacter niastensis]|uniref:Phage holin family protein n=1 Tax=Lysobacter niastensis TaxID=380629 RepID=A0ABS0B887_9GAMM|nr:phage holin family protein [Lysobacter niastensis]MBF6025118.1 phage holin family protein [Lysobacter niastensis]
MAPAEGGHDEADGERRRPVPDLTGSIHELGESGRASVAAATDAAKALRSLLAADMSLARSAMGRTATFAGIAVAFGASAWLLLVATLVVGLTSLGLSMLLALLVGAAISLAVTAYAGWRAVHYFDYTRLKATRRQLARLGIGELADFMPTPDSPASARDAAHEERERSNNEGPPKDPRGVDITPP